MVIDKKQLLRKLTAIRTGIISKYPFYGTLLMNLKFGIANCGTACTDMSRIIFDPEFTSRLSDEEIKFIMLHELMHCVLQHCIRGKGKDKEIYNIAADIVVNSSIMASLGVDTFMVDGEEVMHLTPYGQEGSLYTVDEVYNMLISSGSKKSSKIIDSHDVWGNIKNIELVQDKWDKNANEAAGRFGSSIDLPLSIRKIMDDANYHSKIRWRELLQDFLQIVNENYDFSFSPADRRFSDFDYILPSFQEEEDMKLRDIWFAVDVSGSMSKKEVDTVMLEINACMQQFPRMQGLISFFNTSVSVPKPFENYDDLMNMIIFGGGGTSFHAIFGYMKDNMTANLPSAVIVLTDGYALYPKEEATLGVPVLWILTKEGEGAPWGKSVYLGD